MGTMTTFDNWWKGLSISATTAWRWREAGWITTVNINGRNYVTKEAVEEFERRAKAGEFAIENRAVGMAAEKAQN